MKNSTKLFNEQLASERAKNLSLKCDYDLLKERYDNLKRYCDSLSGHCECCKDRLSKDYKNYIEQMEDEIVSLIKQRDNYRNDCEYNEQCFQAEREARYRLEDEIKVLKGEKKYPYISLVYILY